MSEEPRKSMVNCISNMIDVFDDINNLQSQEKILHRIVNLLVKDLGCKTCSIVEMHPQTKLLEIKNFYGLSWSFCKNYRQQMNGVELSDLLWKGDPIYVETKENAGNIPESLKMENEFESCIIYRLMAKNQPIGFLYLDSDKSNNFPFEQQQIIQLYSKIISTNIYLHRLWIEMKSLQTKDECGAIRYDYFHPYLQEIFDRSRRLDESFSLLLIDIQGFGAIVKKYGLDCSTNLIKEFVTLVEDNLRLYDGLSRYTADTLLIAFPGSTIENAGKAAEKLLKIINNKEFTKEKFKIKVSMGLACYPVNSKSLEGLLTAVRNSLLEAKRSMKEINSLKPSEIY